MPKPCLLSPCLLTSTRPLLSRQKRSNLGLTSYIKKLVRVQECPPPPPRNFVAYGIIGESISLFLNLYNGPLRKSQHKEEYPGTQIFPHWPLAKREKIGSLWCYEVCWEARLSFSESGDKREEKAFESNISGAAEMGNRPLGAL